MSRRDQPESGQFPPTAGGVINTEPRNNGPVLTGKGGGGGMGGGGGYVIGKSRVCKLVRPPHIN